MSLLTSVVDENSMNGITRQVEMLSNHLQLNTKRHQVTSNNIANVNTPGFKAVEVVTLPKPPNVSNDGTQRRYSVRLKKGHARLDGNNVDIDKEIGQLKKSSLQHKVFTQLIASKIRQLRDAMS